MDNAHKTSDNVTRPKETERRARGSSPSPPPPLHHLQEDNREPESNRTNEN